MALTATHLIDTSAGARMKHRVVAQRLRPLIAAGRAATCPVLDAEAFSSARTHDEYVEIRARRHLAYEQLEIDHDCWQRAFDAQQRLAVSGRPRAVGIVDLLVACLAAQHDLAVVHYDADYEIAAEVIDFEHHWVARRGSLR